MKSNYEIPQKANKLEEVFLQDIKLIVQSAKNTAYAAINFAQVESNWLIGKRIVEQEQDGKNKADYGKRVITLVSDALTEEFGKGYSKTNIRNFRRFYLEFKELSIEQTASAQLKNTDKNQASESLPQKEQTVSARLKNTDKNQTSEGPIQKEQTVSAQLKNTDKDQASESPIQKEQTVSAQLKNTDKDQASESLLQKGQTVSDLLSWSHYERLMRVSNLKARAWYVQQAAEQMWSFRTLDRNISTQYYERLLSSQLSKAVEDEMRDKTQIFETEKLSFIKNPTVLEFLGLANNLGHTEQDVEKAILSNLQDFIMELGSGFAFVARQELIRTQSKNYFIDLVFYNYFLKCFVLIDIKLGQITHQDVGQMDMYVRMFDELKRNEGDNPTIGIVLCSETDEDIARYSILKGNEQLFASKYQLYLPTVKQLQEEVARQTEIIKQQILREAEAKYGK